MAIFRGAGGPGDATTDAANEASVASTKATEAETSAAAAASSASSAATSATTATTKASEASSSATSAASSASSASTSASSAFSSASLAATSATSADDSATAAAASETNAASSASSASTSATNASNSATAASTAQTAAETAQTAAETAETNAAASYDSFDDRYLGAKSSAPTLDNDGDALLTGALYWNTTSNQLFIWDGSAWDPAAFSASGSVTSFNTRTGAVTLSSADVNTALGSDAVLDSDIGTTVQAHSAVLDATTASYTTAEETKLAGIETAADVTDATNVTVAGALMDSELTSEASVKALNQGVATTDSPSFAGLTVDTNTLAVDSTNNRVGINNATPSTTLDVDGSIYSSGIFRSTYSSSATTPSIQPGNDANTGLFHPASDTIGFSTAGAEAMRINSSGNVGIGGAAPVGYRLEVTQNTAADLFVRTYNADTTSTSDTIHQYRVNNDAASNYIQFGDATSASAGQLRYNHSTDTFTFSLATAEKFLMESDGDFHADGDIVAYSTSVSDERLKDDIKIVKSALDKVKQLRGVTFKYKTDGKVSAGVIAQDVEKVLPEAVTEKELPLKQNDGQVYKTVRYDALHALMIEAIKELSDEVARLKRDN